MPKQFNARIQLKSDTTENWNAVNNTFRPLMGEMIIYLPSSSYPNTRVKIGDGSTLLGSLDFIDAGTINGNEVEIVQINNYDAKPAIGSSDKLYIDISTNRIYYYNETTGYHQLSNFSLNLTTDAVSEVTSWGPGSPTLVVFENNILRIIQGTAPQLLTNNKTVVTNVTKG